MEVGRLDRLITIEYRVEATDDWNTPVITWTQRAQVWARMDTRRGKDTDESQQRTQSYPVVFYMYWRSDLAETDRLSYDGKKYQIESIEEVGYRDMLKVYAVAKDNYEDA